MAWDYKREESQFQELPKGRYRVMIDSAEMAVSKSGNDMLVIRVLVSGTQMHLWNYITFLDDRPEITNRMLTQLFDSFDIEEGNFNLNTYVGHFGGCQVKHDDQGRAKISYFLSKKQQQDLPPWKGEVPKIQEIKGDDGELPF